MTLREAAPTDLGQLLDLYLHLHEDSIPQEDAHLRATWQQILDDPNHP